MVTLSGCMCRLQHGCFSCCLGVVVLYDIIEVETGINVVMFGSKSVTLQQHVMHNGSCVHNRVNVLPVLAKERLTRHSENAHAPPQPTDSVLGVFSIFDDDLTERAFLHRWGIRSWSLAHLPLMVAAIDDGPSTFSCDGASLGVIQGILLVQEERVRSHPLDVRVIPDASFVVCCTRESCRKSHKICSKKVQRKAEIERTGRHRVHPRGMIDHQLIHYSCASLLPVIFRVPCGRPTVPHNMESFEGVDATRQTEDILRSKWGTAVQHTHCCDTRAHFHKARQLFVADASVRRRIFG
jgi:hypothetical protein